MNTPVQDVITQRDLQAVMEADALLNHSAWALKLRLHDGATVEPGPLELHREGDFGRNCEHRADISVAGIHVGIAKSAVPNASELSEKDRKILAICRGREILTCIEYTCWPYASMQSHRVQNNLSSMDGDGDMVTAWEKQAVLDSVAPVTVIIRPGTAAADALRLLRKVTGFIEERGFAEGCPTQHPFLRAHPELER
jgi:hypothetical protein